MQRTVVTVVLSVGQEHPGQGEVLELVEVAEVVMGRQALRTYPIERFTQPALRDPHARLQRCDWPHVGREVTPIPALGLVEQIERALQIALDLPEASHGHAPA